MTSSSKFKASTPPVLIDHRLWRHEERLNLAINGIFELRELPDQTFSGFSRWTDESGTWNVHVLFNSKHQLLSAQVVDTDMIDRLIAQGIPIWTDSDREPETLSIESLRRSVNRQLGGKV